MNAPLVTKYCLEVGNTHGIASMRRTAYFVQQEAPFLYIFAPWIILRVIAFCKTKHAVHTTQTNMVIASLLHDASHL